MSQRQGVAWMSATVRAIAWGISGLLALVLLTQPVSVHSQLALSGTVIVGLIAVWTFGRGIVARQLFLAMASFVVIRYQYWRWTSTLPPASDPLAFAIGLILIIAETYCVVILTISLVINADPLVRPRLERDDDENLPVVDVFIPTYNEDEYILATTVAAAKSMDYPADKLNVWLLDDGGTDQKCSDANFAKRSEAIERRKALRALCAEIGCTYLTRARNLHAKAGNINSAMAHSRGDLILILDADHVPAADILERTVPWFMKDDKVFLVQTPRRAAQIAKEFQDIWPSGWGVAGTPASANSLRDGVLWGKYLSLTNSEPFNLLTNMVVDPQGRVQFFPAISREDWRKGVVIPEAQPLTASLCFLSPRAGCRCLLHWRLASHFLQGSDAVLRGRMG